MSLSRGLALAACLTAAACAPAHPAGGTPPRDARAEGLARDLDGLRARLPLPAVSVAVVEGDRVTWAQGFGFADAAHRVPATPDTVYPVASLTKSLAATAAMQLVEQGKLRLDAPVSRYASDGDVDPRTTVASYLSHTSDDAPGSYFFYSGARYARLTPILERASGEPFGVLLRTRVLEPAGMTRSSAGVGDATAQLYAMRDGHPTPAEYAGKLSTATGVASTALDLARFVLALRSGALLSPASVAQMQTAARDTRGRALPYGLGWFVETYRGEPLVWGYGQESTNSALMLVVPRRGLALVALASSIALSDPFWLLLGRVERSELALDFLHRYVFGDGDRPGEDDVVARALEAAWTGDRAGSDALLRGALREDPELATRPDPSLLAAFARSDDEGVRAAGVSVGRALLGETPEHPRTLFDLGELYLRGKDEARASELFAAVSAKRSLSTRWLLAECDLELGRYWATRDAHLAAHYLELVREEGDAQARGEAARLLEGLGL